MMKDISQQGVFLSKNYTISKYLQMEKEGNKIELIRFIKERFTERYITPLRSESDIKHGFCTMAICCLMIETLESFWQGWGDTSGKGKLTFCSFFNRSNNLSIFNNHKTDFYKNVRCGILHQAETKNGWQIHRVGLLLDSKTKTINATKFHNEMEVCLNDYCSVLEKLEWDSEAWINFRKKMKIIIANCSRFK
ncbi:hypothetical protein ACFL0Y_01350 [Patescibacteria group bacterium]